MTGDRFVVRPAARLEGELRVPGDKSISHRALIVGAMGHGAMHIAGCSPAEDVAATLEAIRGMGIGARDESNSRSGLAYESKLETETLGTSRLSRDCQYLVEGRGVGAWDSPSSMLDVGNSGSTIRMLLGPLAGSSVGATLTGDGSILRRPMARVVEPLRRMGADIEGAAGGDKAPLVVRGTTLHGVEHDLPVPSAQVKSALLLAGLLAEGRTVVREPTRSRDHTERLLEYLSLPIDISTKQCVVQATEIQNRDVDVPGDLSSAAFFLVAAAMLPGSDVTIHGVGLNPTRSGILDILGAFGAKVSIAEVVERCGEPRGSVRVRSNDRRALDVSGDLAVRAIDELPLVALLGACADGGVTRVSDAAELRVKESDRVTTMARALGMMGVGIEALPAGFSVKGGRLTGARVDSAGDHRIAMAAAVAGLAAAGETVVEGWSCVGVSYPGFEQDLERLVVR